MFAVWLLPAFAATPYKSFRFPSKTVGISFPFNLGSSNTGSATDLLSTDSTLSYRIQASASGVLQTGYFYFGSYNSPAQVKIAIYGPSLTTTPVTDTTAPLVGVSGVLNYSPNSWVSASMSGGTVAAGSYYWVTIITSTTNVIKYAYTVAGSTTAYYGSSPGNYASPSAFVWATASTTTEAPISAYVTAQ